MSQQSQPTYYPVEKSLIDKNNNQITPHESIIVEKDSGFVQTTINQLRHLFELAINESFVLLPPQDAAQYFDHPFNQSPYFEIIYNTLTMLFSHVAKQSLDNYDQLVLDQFHLDQHLTTLENTLLKQFQSRQNTVQDNNQTNQQNQQNLSNNSEIFQKSVTLLTKEMAIKKQQEQIQFLEALLLQQTLENQEMEHKLNSLFKSSQKIFTSEHNFVEKLREIEPLCENIEQNIQSDFKLQ